MNRTTQHNVFNKVQMPWPIKWNITTPVLCRMLKRIRRWDVLYSRCVKNRESRGISARGELDWWPFRLFSRTHRPWNVFAQRGYILHFRWALPRPSFFCFLWINLNLSWRCNGQAGKIWNCFAAIIFRLFMYVFQSNSYIILLTLSF